MRKVMIFAFPLITGRFDRRQTDERLFSIGLCLPSGTAMTDSDLERVAGIVRKCAGAFAN